MENQRLKDRELRLDDLQRAHRRDFESKTIDRDDLTVGSNALDTSTLVRLG
jgi:hypothetical protein